MATTFYKANGDTILIDTDSTYTADVTVTVGTGGDCTTLNAALAAITAKYPAYKAGGVEVKVKILSGTTIHEQITVQKADFSYVTIIAEDAYVPVNVDGFTAQGLNSHDLRNPNVGAFIGGENGAGLPCIGCVFKVTQNTDNIAVVGYFANRSSKGVVLASSGFDSFYDGVISNNESSVTIRQGIARNMTRWGVHARHNGEVSARSADLTNCAVGAYADRVANLDAREADCGGCGRAIYACHASQICAAGTNCANGGDGSSGSIIVDAESGSVVDANGMKITDPNCDAVFAVNYGGIITANLLDNFSNRRKCTVFNKTRNTFTDYHGIILANSDYTSHTLTVSATPAGATVTVKRNTTVIQPDTEGGTAYTVLDGTYTVTVSAEGYTEQTQSVTLTADTTVTVELAEA